MRKIVLFISALSVLTVLTVQAQYSTKGFFVKPHAIGAAWTLDDLDVDAESGGGGGLSLGYGFSDLLAIYFEGSAAQIDPDGGVKYTLAHADLGLQATLGSPSSRIKVFFTGAVSGRVAELRFAGQTIELSGPGYTVGGGVNYFFSSALGLDAGLQATFGSIEEVKVGAFSEEVSIDATSLRVNLGLVWYPGR